MSKDAAIRRALRALRTDEDGHPGVNVLEAYVEGRLSAEDRRRIDELALQLPMVAEDLSDLQRIHDQIARHQTRRAVRWGRVAAGAAVAASALFGVWVATRSPRQTEPVATTAALTAEQRSVVDNALADARVMVPENVRQLRRPAGTLLGSGPAAQRFSPLTPVATAVRSQRPTFTWTSADADGYTVAVFDERFVEVARSPRLSTTSWTLAIDLARGATYLWQVTAHRPAGDVIAPQPPDPEARFAVADADTAARFDALEARLGDDPLTFGILLANAGLVSEAREQLERASRLPATEATARRLLTSLDAYGTPTTTKPAQ